MEKPAKRTRAKKEGTKKTTPRTTRKNAKAPTFTDEQIESILKSAQNTYKPGVREKLAERLKKLRLKKKYTSPFSDEVLDATQTEFQAVLRVQAYVKGYTERL